MPANGQSKKKQIVSLNVTIDSLENALSQSKGKILSLEQQMKVLENKFNLKMEEHSNEKSNLNNTIEQLRKKNDILQIALDETNNQLAQLQKKKIEKNEKFLRVLSDSARNATLISELIPENCIVQASEIYDINGDFIDDFVVIYQDTVGFSNQWPYSGSFFNSPIIIEGYIFNRNLKSLEKIFHCTDLIYYWNSPYGEEVSIQLKRDNNLVSLILNHDGISFIVHVHENIVFNYDQNENDFLLNSIEFLAISRDETQQVEGCYLADFEEKIIEVHNKPKRIINFEAPTLSEWPNGNWKLLGWRSE